MAYDLLIKNGLVIDGTATPFFVDGKPTHPRGGAPYLIGEHTHDVLSTMLGYPGDRIETLRKLGVIEMPDRSG